MTIELGTPMETSTGLGYIRYDHIGEGSYDQTEKAIQSLLVERAAQNTKMSTLCKTLHLVVAIYIPALHCRYSYCVH
jgi:hypothetical protein